MTTNPEDTGEPALVPIPAPKKKKRSKRPKSKKGKNKPTGFEEYYVDAPITAEEHEFELDLYHVSRPITHRLENGILRFSKNRRMEPDRLEVFNKYLQYGGIDVSPKMFAGVDERGMKEMDKEDILLARGNTSINQGHSKLIIDFNAVVKGYLTSYFPFYFNPFTEDMIKLATVTIRSFLSYLLYHDVCPEYRENIDEARKSCDIATGELWKNQQLTAEGTDDFNKACSILFGGFEQELYIEDNQWEGSQDDKVHMTRNIAQKVVRFGLGVAGSDDVASTFQHKAVSGTLTAKKLQDIHGFEVTGVHFLDNNARQFYQDQAPDLHPVGILSGRTYYDPAEPEYDLSPEEQEAWAKNGLPVQEFTFFLEERLLEHCYPGMKIIANVWELNCGFHYFEEVIRAYGSIYTPLANELMMGWKKPRALAAKKDQEESDAERRQSLGGTTEVIRMFS